MDLNAIIHVSGDTAYVYAFISDPANNGVPVDADAAPTFRLYRGENGTPVATGTMALFDDANTTGFYSEAISIAGLAPGVYVIRLLATVGTNPAHTGKVFVVGGAGPLLVRTTIATLASQTSFTLTGGPAQDNVLRDCTVIIRDSASIDLFCWGFISAYTGATKTVTLSGDPGIFTMAVGDTVEVWAPTTGRLANLAHGGTAATLTAERVVIASTTTNEPALKLTGNGTGDGIYATGGATGHGLHANGGASGGAGIHAHAHGNDSAVVLEGHGTGLGMSIIGGTGGGGLYIQGNGTEAGLYIDGGTNGHAVELWGGGTSGVALSMNSNADNVVEITAVGGHGVVVQANGTSMHGILVTGGTGGTSDGLKLVAGTGGVGFRVDTMTVTTNAIAWNAAWDAEVQSEVADALTAFGASTLTAAAAADAVWDEILAGHLGVGSTGEALNAAGAAGDPWTTALPGAYGAGSAGKIIGDNINATISSRAAQTTLDALVTTVGVAGAGLTAADDATLAAIAALNNLSSAQAQTAAAAALTAFGASTVTTAQVNAEVDTALSDAGVTLARMGALTDWIDGGRLDLLLDGVVGDNPNRPTRGVELGDVMFMMVDETDGKTPEPAITVTATISKDGGAFAACTNAVSEVSGGWYKITLTATELTANSVALKMTGSGCAQTNLAIRTQPT